MASPVPGLQYINHAQILFNAYNAVKRLLQKDALPFKKSKNAKSNGIY
jgi:hypothetical protein